MAFQTNVVVQGGRLSSVKVMLAAPIGSIYATQFSTYVVGDQVDTRDLLVHLTDICQNDSVELAIFAHLK